MLLPNMSIDEIRNDLMSDIDEIRERAIKFMPKFRRMVIKKKMRKKELWFNKKLTSQRKTKWIVKYWNTGDGTRFFFLGAYYYSNKGFRYIQIDNKEIGSLHFYNCHFLRRYNERKGYDFTDPYDIIQQFLNDNTQLGKITKKEQKRKGVYAVEEQCIEGTKLGKHLVEENAYIWNTFIGENEYSNEQFKRYANTFNSGGKKELDALMVPLDQLRIAVNQIAKENNFLDHSHRLLVPPCEIYNMP